MIASPSATGEDEVQGSIAKAYLQLNQAEQAASRMESMLDTIELKMQQLEEMQASDSSSGNAYEFQKLTVELDDLQKGVQAMQKDMALEED